MSRINILTVLAVVFISCPLFAFDRHQSRHIDRVEFLAPLGTHQLGDLFRSLIDLNGLADDAFPKVKDATMVTLRPGDRKRSFLISGKELLGHLKSQVKLFKRSYQVKVSRRYFRLFKVEETKGDDLGVVEDPKLWMKSLPKIEEKIVIAVGEESELRSGYYESEVLIQGKATLEEGDAVFQDLKIEGSLAISGKKVHGDNLMAKGDIELKDSSKVEFENVKTGGDIILDSGSHLKTKHVHFSENGRLVLGEDSHLILN